MGMMKIWDTLLGLLYDFPYFDLYFVGRPVNALSGFGAAVLRCMSGGMVAAGTQGCVRPAKTLRLYEFEACPFCRKVREALCVLDLDAEIRPCPKPSAADAVSRFRGEVENPDGKTTFPVLVDDNVVIRGSEEIVSHLWKTYGGQATPPISYNLGRRLDGIMPLFILPMFLRMRPSHGMVQHPSRQPAKPLVLWGYETSPFVKVVREALCCLELLYVHKAVAHGSEAKRREFAASYGQYMRQQQLRESLSAIQVPMLLDPNRDETPMFESAEIVHYLYATYGTPAVKSE